MNKTKENKHQRNGYTTFMFYFLKTTLTFSIVASLIVKTSCFEEEEIKDIKYEILNNKESHFYIDFDEYPEDKTPLPIGVFDSGTGGLAVLNDIAEYKESDNDEKKRIFENESFIYLADMANMPYGSYALEDNTALLQEHIIKNTQFLLDNKYYRNAEDTEYMTDKSPVKAIVVACNTATAYGMEMINNFLDQAGLDIIVKGVIDAAANGVINYFSPDEDGSIAVLATDGTVRSGAYVSAIVESKMELERHGNILIFQQAGIGIAEAIDQNKDFTDRSLEQPREGYMGPSDKKEDNLNIDLSIWDRYNFNMENEAMLYEGYPDDPYNIQINSVENYVAYHLVSLMEKIKTRRAQEPLRSIVLGCTHYPYVEDTFHEVINDLRNYQEDGEYIYREYMADSIIMVNPAVKIADQLYEALEERDILANNHYKDSEFYIAVPNVLNEHVELREDGTFTYEYKYGREAGNIQEYVKRTPFSRHAIDDDILERLSGQVPTVYEMMVNFNNKNPKTEYLQEEKRIK